MRITPPALSRTTAAGTFAPLGGVGLLSARPAAGAANAGGYYLATDVAGGTLYRSNGVSWVQASAGVNDPTTTLYLSHAEFSLYFAAAALGEVPNNSGHAWLFDSAATEGINTSLVMPSGWSTFDILLYWTNAGAGAGDVRWSFNVSRVDDGDTVGADLLDYPLTVTAPAQNVLKVTTLAEDIAVTANQLIVLQATRLGAAAADTLANDAALYGVLLRKAS